MSGALLRFIFLRLSRAALTVIGIVSIVFALVNAIPGDPVNAILGDQASPEDRAAMREALGLNEPLLDRYANFWHHVVDGTLGMSFRHPTTTVASMIAEVVPDTGRLAVAALAIAWLIAIPLGCIAAARRDTLWDRSASTFAVLGLAIPNIWLGPLLILAFAVKLRWLPLPGDDLAGPERLLLPAITIGTALAAVLTRQTRAAMREVLRQPYIIAARARGIPETTLVGKHALRNAMLPIVTIGAAQIGALLSGAVVTEKIFDRPGVGTLFLEAFFARDIPVVQGCVLLIALLYVSLNIAVDLIYGFIDPRVRFV
ncbi:MAG: ABC transporter permease [Polyangiales bacterium]